MAKAATKPTSPIDRALRLLEAGDVLGARKEAQSALAASPDEETAKKANAILSRTAFPKRAFVLAGVALSLWLGMVLLAVFRG